MEELPENRQELAVNVQMGLASCGGKEGGGGGHEESKTTGKLEDANRDLV